MNRGLPLLMQHLIGEYNSNGSPIQETIYLGDTPIAIITPTNQVHYLYTDHLNTPRLITNHANQVRWTWHPEQSGAFGAGLPDDNPSVLGTFTFNLRFTGQLYDPASQLSYNYYRDYNSATGRYIESDPIGLAGGINTYAYVNGNPLSYIDPRGLDALSEALGGDRSRGGFTPIPGPFDVFFPSTPANQRFVDATFSVIDKVKEMCFTDRCEEAENTCYEECQQHLGEGGRTNQGSPYRNCWVKCMKRHGCYNGDSPVE